MNGDATFRGVPPVCLSLIYKYEQGPTGGFAVTPYYDEGVPCTGWGHRITDPNDPLLHTALNASQATTIAIDDLEIAAEELSKTLGALAVSGLTNGQWAALIDFCFNEGINQFNGSTMLKLIQASNLDAAGGEFSKWVYAKVNGVEQVIASLAARRMDEFNLWTGKTPC